MNVGENYIGQMCVGEGLHRPNDRRTNGVSQFKSAKLCNTCLYKNREKIFMVLVYLSMEVLSMVECWI